MEANVAMFSYSFFSLEISFNLFEDALTNRSVVEERKTQTKTRRFKCGSSLVSYIAVNTFSPFTGFDLTSDFSGRMYCS